MGTWSGRLERRLRAILLVLFALELGITAWNCAVFDGITYDQAGLHVPRARSGGLSTAGRAYNPPLYYLPALPLAAAQGDLDEDGERPTRAERKRRDARLLAALRWTNLVHTAVFFGAWLFWIVPRTVRDPWTGFAVSVLLLALPGYQKLAAMVHPDNALTSLTAVCLATWLWLRERRRAAAPGAVLRGALALAALAGLTGLTRPFGGIATVVFASAAVSLLWEAGLRGARLLRRAAAVLAVAAGLGGAWYGVQWAARGELAPVYSQTYIEPFLEHRDDFDRLGYFTSFHLPELLARPNRTMAELEDPSVDEWHNRHGNSFWTLAYSETWGDHWLYFSGRWQEETKAWPKRILFALALPLVPWVGWRFARGVSRLVARARARDPDALAVAVPLALWVAAIGAFLAWQLTGGLTPGKNSAVKFIYNAWVFPIPLLVAFASPAGPRERWVLITQVLILWLAAVPVSVFWPAS